MLGAIPHLPAAGCCAAVSRLGVIDLAPVGGDAMTLGLSDAKRPQTFRWLSFVGMAGAFSGAPHMIWDGHRSVVVDLGNVGL